MLRRILISRIAVPSISLVAFTADLNGRWERKLISPTIHFPSSSTSNQSLFGSG